MGRSSKKSVYYPQHPTLQPTQQITDRLMSTWYSRLIATWRTLTKGGGAGPLNEWEMRAVVSGVEQLSGGLTRTREMIDITYMDDPELLGAYLLFYWPISYVQTRHVLRHVSGLTTSNALDLGSGPGPGVAALLDAGAQSVTAVDVSTRALGVINRLMPDASTLQSDLSQHRTLDSISADVLLASHALNEWVRAPKDTHLASQWLDLQAQRSGARTLVLIEPALKETSRHLLMIREQLIEQGWSVQAPCVHQQACPALVSEQDWCHANITWSPPDAIQRIADAARIHKSRLKMTYLVMSREAARVDAHDADTYRIVSDAMHQKGRYQYIGCGPAGRVGLTLLARKANALHQRFRDLQRYDVIHLTDTTLKGDGLRLDNDSSLDVLSGPFSMTKDDDA